MAGQIAAGMSAVVAADGEIVAATEGVKHTLVDAMVSPADAVDMQVDNLATETVAAMAAAKSEASAAVVKPEASVVAVKPEALVAEAAI